MSVSPEDRAMSVSLRRLVAKSNLDISQLNISFSRGTCELIGTVRAPKGHEGMQVRKEFQTLIAQIRNVRGVRDVFGERVRIFD
ncbi:MAG TPA: hypothetical protein VF681_09045 [Abditibacteriaceae bacterium]|jgi:hypothetical protein